MKRHALFTLIFLLSIAPLFAKGTKVQIEVCFEEEDTTKGYWQYDVIVVNNSPAGKSGSYLLNSISFELSEKTDPMFLPSGWISTSDNTVIDAMSHYPGKQPEGSDIAPGQLSVFYFALKKRISDIPFRYSMNKDSAPEDVIEGKGIARPVNKPKDGKPVKCAGQVIPIIPSVIQ